MSQLEIQVCIECKHPKRFHRWCGKAGGEVLLERFRNSAALAGLRAGPSAPPVRLRPVACLGNCSRRCRVNLSGPDRWSWLLGNLDPIKDDKELAAVLAAWLQAEKGLIPKAKRSPWLVKKALGRVPPLLSGKGATD